MITVQDVETDHATLAGRSYFPVVRWEAIAAGAVAALSIYVFVNLLGVALGLSPVNVTDTGTRGAHAAFWAMLWNSLSMLVAAFFGGYVAARMSGLKRGSDGVMHGFVSWSVTTLMFVLLATSGSGAVFRGLVEGVNARFVQNEASALTSGGAMLGEKLEALLQGNNAAAAAVDPIVVQNLRQQIRGGQRGPAIDLMVNSLGFDREHAAAVVDQTLIVGQHASSEGPTAVSRTLSTASGSTTWWLLGAVTLSLLFGVIGGSLGSAASRPIRRADNEE